MAFYLLKKFLLIWVAVNVEINLLQFCYALYIQEIFTIYILQLKPMDRPSRQYNEQFNEITIILIIVILSLLTDYVPSAALRYQIGSAVMILIYAQVFVNTLFLFMDVFYSLRRVYKTLKYQYAMLQMGSQVKTHNAVVDKID